MNVNERMCQCCGKEFVSYNGIQKYCGPECKREANRLWQAEYQRMYGKDYRKRTKRKSSSSDELVRIAVAARKEGLSYGQYVAKYHL